MIRKQKKFDCVEMKRKAQETILNAYKGLSDDEAVAQQLKDIQKNPVLGPFLRKIRMKMKAESKMH